MSQMMGRGGAPEGRDVASLFTSQVSETIREFFYYVAHSL